MLILTRKLNERIDMRDDTGQVVATITVTQVKGRNVRLGFDADGFRIDRRREEKGPLAPTADQDDGIE